MKSPASGGIADLGATVPLWLTLVDAGASATAASRTTTAAPRAATRKPTAL